MKTTRTYQSGCTWCQAMGYVKDPQPQLTGNFTMICPVCNGAKTIIVTDTIETEPIPIKP